MKGFINGVFNYFSYNTLHYNFRFQQQKGINRQIKTAPNQGHYDLDMVPPNN